MKQRSVLRDSTWKSLRRSSCHRLCELFRSYLLFDSVDRIAKFFSNNYELQKWFRCAGVFNSITASEFHSRKDEDSVEKGTKGPCPATGVYGIWNKPPGVSSEL